MCLQLQSFFKMESLLAFPYCRLLRFFIRIRIRAVKEVQLDLPKNGTLCEAYLENHRQASPEFSKSPPRMIDSAEPLASFAA